MCDQPRSVPDAEALTRWVRAAARSVQRHVEADRLERARIHALFSLPPTPTTIVVPLPPRYVADDDAREV